MGSERRKEIKHHLSEEKLDELLRGAEGKHRIRRPGFVKNLYQGDTIAEAADREARSAATGGRWADAWNEGGLEELMPSFGGGRPPRKFDEDEQDKLLELLQNGQPWKSREIQHLLAEEFGVEYHPDYLGKFSGILASRTQNHAQNGRIGRRIPRRSSTRLTTSPTIRRKANKKTDGLLTTIFVQTAVRSSAFLMLHTRSRMIMEST